MSKVTLQKEKDQEDLRKFGYIQELNRSMNLFTNFAIAFSLISPLTGISVLYDYGIQYSGLAGVPLLPIVGIFQFLVAFSLSEIAAIYPVAGGVYKWTTILSNKTLGWFSGMAAIIGWSACGIGVAYGLTQFLLSLFHIRFASDLMILTIMGVLLFSYSIMNLCGMQLVKWFCHASVMIHIVGILLIASLLFIFGQSTTDLSLESQVLSMDNWPGLLSTVLLCHWVFTGFDASANVSEESLNPSSSVPLGIMLSVVISYVLGNLFLLSLGYATGDVSQIAASHQPGIFYVISQVLGPIVSKYLFLIILVAMFICGLAKQTLIVRMIYALSRDNALPKANVLKVVSPTYEVPTYSVIVAGAIILFASIFTVMLPSDPLPLLIAVSALGICLSHAITIASSFKHLIRYDRRQFRHKPLSIVARAIAILWLSVICIIVGFFNIWGVLVVTALLGVLSIYYFVVLKNDPGYESNIALSEEDLIRIEKLRRN